MAHARKQIRDAIKTLLTGLTTTGTTVYKSRVYPVETLPALSIYTLSESVEETDQSGVQLRVLILVIEGRVKANLSLDDTLDDIASEVETALMADQFLSSLSLPVKLTELTETEIEMVDDLEKPTGIVRLYFNITYSVDETDPNTLVD